MFQTHSYESDSTDEAYLQRLMVKVFKEVCVFFLISNNVCYTSVFIRQVKTKYFFSRKKIIVFSTKTL